MSFTTPSQVGVDLLFAARQIFPRSFRRIKVLSERHIVNAAARTNDVGKTKGVTGVCWDLGGWA